MLEANSKSAKIVCFFEETIDDWNHNATQKALAEELKQYPVEKVVFFPQDRVLTVETEIISDIMESERLMGAMSTYDSYLSRIERMFDISDPYVFRGKKKGDRLESGYMQIMNFLYTIRFHAEENCIVAIEFPETNIHECLRVPLIETIASMPKVKKVFLATRSETIYKTMAKQYECDIK